jgi:CheY-like chemotaxis protein
MMKKICAYMLQLTLESEGYEVETASNGAEGIAKIHSII